MPVADEIVLNAPQSDVEFVMDRTLANTAALLHNRACVEWIPAGNW
jgi:hypothetical protein